MRAICILAYSLYNSARFYLSEFSSLDKTDTGPFFGGCLTTGFFILVLGVVLLLASLLLLSWPFFMCWFAYQLPVVPTVAIGAVLTPMFWGCILGVKPWWNIWSLPKRIEDIKRGFEPCLDICQIIFLLSCLVFFAAGVYLEWTRINSLP